MTATIPERPTDATLAREDRLAALVRDAEAAMHGEAGELAARRPHRDAHLYDIEEGLRFQARELETSRNAETNSQ